MLPLTKYKTINNILRYEDRMLHNCTLTLVPLQSFMLKLLNFFVSFLYHLPHHTMQSETLAPLRKSALVNYIDMYVIH